MRPPSSWHLYVETQPPQGGKGDRHHPRDGAPGHSGVRGLETTNLSQSLNGKEVTVRPSAVSSSPAAQTRPSTSPISCATTSASASGRPGPARPIWPWRRRWDALERQEIRRILLTRPAVEAGEKLGFLPGDLSQKVDPYLRPSTTPCSRCWASKAGGEADGAQHHRGGAARLHARKDPQ